MLFKVCLLKGTLQCSITSEWGQHRKKPLWGSLGRQGREVARFQHLLSLQEGGWVHTRTTKDLSELPEPSFSASLLVNPLT